MKSANRILISSLSVVLLALLGVSLTSCTDDVVGSQVDEDGTPRITGVRYVNPDSSRNVEQIGPGDWVALLGENMDASTEVYFDGIQTSFNPALMTDTSLVVMVPSDLPFGLMDPDSEEFNTIRVANSNGSSVIDFPVIPPPPSVASVSNEFAQAGETIRITGSFLYLTESVTFPGGVTGTVVESAPDGTWMRVEVPQGVSEGGAIRIETAAGVASSAPAASFRDPAGVVTDFDDVNAYSWGANVESSLAGAHGSYALMTHEGVAGGDWGWWNPARSVNLDPVEWVAPANLSDPISSYALKFEVNVLEPMEYGTILIRHDDNWTYIARWEPWTDSETAYVTDGWRTVTIPLTEFRTKSADGVDGAGTSAPSLTQLLGDDGMAPIGFMYVNDDAAETVQPLNMAMDNIRVVKVQ